MTYDLTRVLFSIDDHKFTCDEFLQAMDFYGVYEDWQERITTGAALLAVAEKEKRQTSPDILTAMTNEFRYTQKLLTTEEFHDWLRNIGLELADFEIYLKRTYWTNLTTEIVGSRSEFKVSDRDFFAAIYFSGSFDGLLDSWQQRLLAWKESNGGAFPDLRILEAAFKLYKSSLLDFFDVEQWLECHHFSMTHFKLECLAGELTILLANKDIPGADLAPLSQDKRLQLVEISSFFKDLPDELQDYLTVAVEGEIFGPLRYDSRFLLCRLVNKTLPLKSDETVVRELQHDFRREVWKTLKVKYVRNG